jgi:hypothetical protein
MRGATNLSLAVGMAAVTSGVATVDAQEVRGHPWAFSANFGGAPTAIGGGIGPLMRAPVLFGGSFKVRLGHRPWWVGIDYDGFVAPPTPAGLDSIIADTGKPLNREQGGEFGIDVLSISLRHDVWTFHPLTAYEIATIGRATSYGTIYGAGCTFSGCAVPTTSVYYPGSHFAASVGWGMLVRLPDVPARLSYFLLAPGNIHVEARLASMGTRHGRILSAPLVVGMTW